MSERIDRRYQPLSTTPNSLKIALLCAIGLCLGIGAFGWGFKVYSDEEPIAAAQGILLAAPLLAAVWIWLLGSREVPVRVGPSGIAREEGEVVRVPWYKIERIGLVDGALSVRGEAEDGAKVDWLIRVKAQPEASRHIVREAQSRVPDVLDLSAELRAEMSKGSTASGTPVKEELVLVGKRCASSGKQLTIVTEARACERCGRPYHKSHVPQTCGCGAKLNEPGALLYG